MEYLASDSRNLASHIRTGKALRQSPYSAVLEQKNPCNIFLKLVSLKHKLKYLVLLEVKILILSICSDFTA